LDILAHGLWPGIEALSRRRVIAARSKIAVVALAVLPDIVHIVPPAVAAISGAMPWSTVWTYAAAAPGTEPAMPALVALLSHHLHCIMHSVVVLGAATLVTSLLAPSVSLALLGWWLHYYVVPIFYPLTYWGLNGIAWNQPWFMVVNYASVVVALIFITKSRRASQEETATGPMQRARF
jgi:hypothetical protein